MAGIINGGEVRIKFTPDTEGFREKALDELRYFDDKTVPVKFDVDDARLRETEDRINGNDLHQRVQFETDDQRLQQAARELDQLRSKSKLDLTPDTAKFDEGLRQMSEADKRLRNQLGQNMPTKGIYEYTRELEKAQNLSSRYTHDIENQRQAIARETGEYQRLSGRLAEMQRRQESVAKGSAEYEKLSKSISDVEKKLTSTSGKIGRAQNRIQGWSRSLRSVSAQVDKLTHDLSSMNREADRVGSTRWMTNSMPFMTHLRAAAREQEQAVKTAREESTALDVAIKASGEDAKNYIHTVQDSLGNTFRKVDSEALQSALSVQRNTDSETDNIKKLRSEVTWLQKRMEELRHTFSLGVGNTSTIRNATSEIDRLNHAIDRLNIHQRVNMASLDHSFDKVGRRLNEYSENLNRLNNKNVQIDFTEKGYDKVDDQIRRLEHERLDVPVDLKLSLEQIRRRWAELRREAHNGKDITYDVDLDLKTREARRKINRFQRRNNNLNMDVDLETKLARLHLAEFTRPRVINVFARLHTTDLGKIFYGATYGATGLSAMEDQFQKLVDLFDKINKRVPMYMGIANLFTAIGASVLSLTQATLGVGAGLVEMSKAALATPSAFIGLGSAVGSAVILIHAYSGQIKKDFSGISAQVKQGFSLTASSGIRQLSQQVMPQLARGMRQIAGAEGNLFTNFVRTTNDAVNGPIKTLPTIFNNTAKAVNVLSPGVASLWRSMLGLGSDTSHYLPQMARWVDRLADSWAHWLRNAEQTGRIDYAVHDAVTQGHLLVQSMRDVIHFAEGLWRAMNPKSHGLEGFESVLAAMNRAVQSSRFQDVMGAWSRASQAAAHQIRESLGSVAHSMSVLKTPMADLIRQSGTIVTAVLKDGSRLLSRVGPGLDQLVRGTAQGLHEIITAIGTADPAFNSLLKMIGDMARTFGGTFAATLRDSAPLIKSVADAADLVARAFARLPEPIRAAIGMYVTWGRAGQNLYRSLKTGILQNITQMLQYRKMLNDVGVSVDSMSEIRLPRLMQAWHAAYSGNDAEGISALSAGLTTAGNAAETTGSKVRTVGEAVRETGSAAETAATAATSVGTSMEASSAHVGRMGTALQHVKGVFNDFIDLAGGWQTIGITGGFLAITSAIDNVQQHAQGLEDEINKVSDAFKHVGDVMGHNNSASFLSDKMSKALNGKGIAGSQNGGNNFWDKLWYHWGIGVKQYDTANQALKELGKSQQWYNGYIEKGTTGVSKLRGILRSMVDKYNWTDWSKSNAAQRLLDAIPGMVKQYKDARNAVSDYIDGLGHITEMHGKVEQSFQGLTETFKSNHGAFTGNSADARANRDAMQRAAEAAKIEANEIQENSKAYGGQKEATQEAKNAIQGYRDELVQSLEASGMSERDANKMADSLGLVADKWNRLQGVTKKTADTYMNMMHVTPDVQKRINTAISNHTITSWKDLHTVISALERDASKKIVFTADGHAVAATAKQCREFGVHWNGKRWVSTFDAKDFASKKMNALADRWHTVGLHISNLKAILDADPTKAKKGIDDVGTMAEALGLKPATVKIITSGAKLTKSQIADIKLQLHDKGFTDAEIKVALGLFGVEDLSKQVKDAKDKENKGKPIKVPTKANTKGMKGDVAKGKKSAGGGKPINVKTKADTKGLKKDVEKGKKAASKGKPINIKTKAETKKAQNQIKALTKQVKDLQKQKKNLSIKAKAETKKAQSQVKALTKQIQALKKQKKNLTVTAKSNTKKANSQIKALTKQVASLKRNARNIRLRATADTRAADKQIAALKRRIATLRKARGHVTVTASTGGAVRGLNAVTSAVHRIPRGHHTTITQSGAASVVGAATRVRATINRIQRRHLTSIIERGAGGVVEWADRVKSAIRTVPRSHHTTFRASMDGSWGAVRGSIQSFVDSINSQTVTIHVREVKGHALGGRITGPGTETSDSIPAMLSRNEMVLNAASVHKIDRRYPGLLDRMNTVGDLGDLKLERPLRLAQGTVELSNMTIDSLPSGDDALASEIHALNVNLTREMSGLRSDTSKSNDVLAGEVHDLRAELPDDISRNSSPWPSARAFGRDVDRWGRR